MERVLELLGNDSGASVGVAINMITPSLLSNATEQSKHKLKTRISAFLKKSGPTRAYGAILARRAMADWSTIKSHGASWAVILLHVLDLPDPVCWGPATKTLTYLFAKVQGKSDLAREIAGSKIGDFMKRLVLTLPTTKSYYAVRAMLQLYPTQCRPHLNKLEPLLRSEDPTALAYLCLSEKQNGEVWTRRFGEHLDVLRGHENNRLTETEIAHNLEALQAYISVASAINVKVPAQQLFSVLIKLLTSFTPAAVHCSCSFIKTTFPHLKTMYVQQFEVLVYTLSDCLEMGLQEAVVCLSIISMLVDSAGWVSENYFQLFTRLTKKTLNILEKKESAVGAQGLADYVQNPAAFITPTLNPASKDILLNFLIAVIRNVPGIPQSCRANVDRVILSDGSAKQIVIAALHPAKYSILPLAINRLPELSGLETLIHPRFPPLNTSKHLLEQNSEIDGLSDEIEEPKFTSAIQPSEQQKETEEETKQETLDIEPEAEDSQPAPLPKMPESNKPVHRPELGEPPEKRAKVEIKDNDLAQQPSTEMLINAGVANDNENSNDGAEEEERAANEDDEELVIPTLNMDSD